ncbi:MAG: type I phosphomannose isomerase catalytic subunit [Armatimonadota bacterium]|nr:class I mannose-6-phosphate isomerase [bacterium]
MSRFNYPLLLEPVSVPRPWGGGRVCKLYDRAHVESSQPIGEAWDVSTWPKDPGDPNLATVTHITNGSLAGTPLDQIVNVPVVVKLLDSAEKLSVQVHPVSENEHKDEMWYILHADPGAYLFCGLKDGVDKNAFCDVIHSKDPSEEQVLDMLVRADDPKPGTYFNVPTGTVHAVGPGLVAFEISEQTQITYRLFDYNRGRALHLDDGCKAVMAVRPNLPVLDAGLKIDGAQNVETITEFPTFCVVKATGDKIAVQSSKHMHLVTATMGTCKLSGPTADWNITLKHSFTCLVPATTEPYTIDTCGSGDVLISPLKD